MNGMTKQGPARPPSSGDCPTCGMEMGWHLRKSGRESQACPYEGLPYAELRAGHDRIYFGQWRKMEYLPVEIVKAYTQLGRHLKAIGQVLDREDLPAARRDHTRAVEAYRLADPRDDSREALRFMDNALSYAHRVIDDLLHEKGFPSHAPMDYAGWYDAVEIPFRDEW